MTAADLAPFLFDVVSSMAIFVLAVLGLGVIASMMGIFNFAHGEFLLLGAYTVYLTQERPPDMGRNDRSSFCRRPYRARSRTNDHTQVLFDASGGDDQYVCYWPRSQGERPTTARRTVL